MVTKDTIFNGKFGQHTFLNQGMILVFYTVGSVHLFIQYNDII